VLGKAVYLLRNKNYCNAANVNLLFLKIAKANCLRGIEIGTAAISEAITRCESESTSVEAWRIFCEGKIQLTVLCRATVELSGYNH